MLRHTKRARLDRACDGFQARQIQISDLRTSRSARGNHQNILGDTLWIVSQAIWLVNMQKSTGKVVLKTSDFESAVRAVDSFKGAGERGRCKTKQGCRVVEEGV